jgi:hypothetical protein
MQHIIDIEKFKEVAPQMLWRGAAVDQIEKLESAVATLTRRLRLTAEVVGSHRSKSIDLPVVMLSTDVGQFTLRDNFSDVNLMAILSHPANLTLDRFFADIQEPLTWEWYLSQVDRARGYSWREWTDEEMSDPRILRVRDKRSSTWWEKTGAEKDRWLNRMFSPAWHSIDWSSGDLTWDGEFGPGVRLYHQGHAYAEGIKVTTSNRKYLKGVSDFIISTNTLESAVAMIERLHVDPFYGSDRFTSIPSTDQIDSRSATPSTRTICNALNT